MIHGDLSSQAFEDVTDGSGDEALRANEREGHADGKEGSGTELRSDTNTASEVSGSGVAESEISGEENVNAENGNAGNDWGLNCPMPEILGNCWKKRLYRIFNWFHR